MIKRALPATGNVVSNIQSGIGSVRDEVVRAGTMIFKNIFLNFGGSVRRRFAERDSRHRVFCRRVALLAS